MGILEDLESFRQWEEPFPRGGWFIPERELIMALGKAPKAKSSEVVTPAVNCHANPPVRNRATGGLRNAHGSRRGSERGGNKTPSWDDTLRETLRDFLGAKGFTLREFCQRTGLNVATVSIFLNQGKRSINLLTAEKIGREIGLCLEKES